MQMATTRPVWDLALQHNLRVADACHHRLQISQGSLMSSTHVTVPSEDVLRLKWVRPAVVLSLVLQVMCRSSGSLLPNSSALYLQASQAMRLTYRLHCRLPL